MVRYRKDVEVSENLQDRRGARGRSTGMKIGGAGGGLAIIVALVFAFLGGGGSGLEDLGPMLEQLQAPSQTPAAEAPLDPEADPDRDLLVYMSVVLDDSQALWAETFAANDMQWRDATLVVFEDATQSGCGGADARYGPHYCPLDETIYLDLGFFQQLQTQFGATGDLAPAYVLAHEVAHHVQQLLGISDQVRSAQQSQPDLANEYSIALELQADCFAGVWASTVYVGRTGADDSGDPVLEIDRGEIAEALEAAAAVGDDRIQEAATGRTDPESWTHGSAEQRQEWFNRGYETGDPNACDTFS